MRTHKSILVKFFLYEEGNQTDNKRAKIRRELFMTSITFVAQEPSIKTTIGKASKREKQQLRKAKKQLILIYTDRNL